MKDKGLVVSSQNKLAEVEVQCFAACLNCSAQSLCLGQSQSKGRVSAKNPLEAMPGDTVFLDIPETMYNKSLSLIFGTLLLATLGRRTFLFPDYLSFPSNFRNFGAFSRALCRRVLAFPLFSKKK